MDGDRGAERERSFLEGSPQDSGVGGRCLQESDLVVKRNGERA